MGLARNQQVAEPVKAKESVWTFRKIFPLISTATSISKKLTNTFDVLLVYLVVIGGASELMGRPLSWKFFLFSIFVLFADLIERRIKEDADLKNEKK